MVVENSLKLDAQDTNNETILEGPLDKIKQNIITANPENKIQATLKPRVVKVYDQNGRVIGEKIADKALPKQESENRLDHNIIRNFSDQDVFIPNLQTKTQQQPDGVIVSKEEDQMINNGTNHHNNMRKH